MTAERAEKRQTWKGSPHLLECRLQYTLKILRFFFLENSFEFVLQFILDDDDDDDEDDDDDDDDGYDYDDEDKDDEKKWW